MHTRRQLGGLPQLMSGLGAFNRQLAGGGGYVLRKGYSWLFFSYFPNMARPQGGYKYVER
jgi:hypothetical protein